jgi:hypothetical protein
MDPFLVPHFQWDAQRLSKFDGTKYVRFIDEPTTADRFWDIQVCTYVPLLLINLLHHIFHYQSGLPPGGNLLAYILYADKTKLSSFGKAMGYPVYAHIGNIDVEIRNGTGIGGGELVGWLPIVW